MWTSRIKQIVLALLNPFFLFLIVILAVTFFFPGRSNAQNAFFVSQEMDMQAVNEHVQSYRFMDYSQCGPQQLQSTKGGATVLYNFEEDKLKDITFYRQYKSRKKSKRQLKEALYFMDRIMAVVIPVEKTESTEWYYARTPEFRYDVKLMPGAKKNWTVMIKRSTPKNEVLANHFTSSLTKTKNQTGKEAQQSETE